MTLLRRGEPTDAQWERLEEAAARESETVQEMLRRAVEVGLFVFDGGGRVSHMWGPRNGEHLARAFEANRRRRLGQGEVA